MPNVSNNLGGSVNGFSINIPQLSIGGASAGSGLSINFDMGASPAGLASQAYDFLNNSFTTDQGFLGQTISGTQSFLAHQISPILASATKQMDQNTKLLPSLYSGITSTAKLSINAIQANTQEGINAENAATMASIAASNAAANSGGGGCYITTAVCASLGLPDDNVILNTLRKFRDEYCGGKLALHLYYATAPGIVRAINARKDARECYRQLLRRSILPAYAMIRAGFYSAAFRFYRAGYFRALQMAGK